ncbi:TonB-dependent receptor [Larkinella humicola]|uniref:TonB-dependent receptor n=2 Tax=Larkinella humicola TaxID=2607654 RepID=A0A5N1JFY4_9BACT|nr:TonB-dependent receptor [Larkinella humicola]
MHTCQRLLCVLVLLGCCSALSWGAASPPVRNNRLLEWQISGKVTSEKGETLPGVTVILKGSSLGTSTDATGNYFLKVPETAGTLVFSSVGTVTKEVPFSGAGVINVALNDDAKALEEVVVVGYGTVKKSSVTAAVSKIENKILNEIPAGRAETALVGRLAGVNVSQTRSSPGSAPLIRIRGAGSIDAGNEPLVVIDGFPGGSLGQINMNDVESIEVLKDASSSAIYGSRAAGGVIIVTTKRGKTGKPRFNFNAYYGFSKARLHNDWLSTEDYYNYAVKYQNREYSWIGGDASIPVWGDARRPAQYQVSDTVRRSASTIWQNEVTQVAPIQSYNLSIGGGNDNVKYYVSGVVLTEQGTVKNTDYNQYGVRANLDVKVSPVVSLGFLLNPTYATRRIAPTDMVSLVKYPNFVAEQRPDGTYPKARDYWGQNVTSQANPMAILDGTFINAYSLNNVGELFVALDLMEGLRFKSSVGTNISYNTNERFQASYATNNGITNGSASDSRSINLINENVLSYNKTFGGVHDFSGLLGASYQRNTSRNAYMAAVAGSYNNDIIHTLNNAIIDPASTATTKSEWGLISYFSRVNYGYKEKYLLSASVRADGSSRFGPANKWGYFPSASVAWRVSQEEFLKNSPAINELKLRASYGATGNFNIGDFDYLGRISSVFYAPNGVLTKGQVQSSFGNNNLSWEKTRGYDFGVELGILKNRLNITVDYYDKRTTDLLYNVSIPAITGFTSSISNVGDIRNKGIEFEIQSKNLTGGLKWQTSFNLARNRNKVVDLGGVQERITTDTYGMSWILRLGEPMFSYYGYKAIGVLQNAEQVKSTPVLVGSKPGNPIYEDINKDGKIDSQDKVILGNFQPKLFLGMVNTFSWKAFDLSLAMQASLGAKIYNFENQFYQGNTLGAMRRSLVENQWWSEQEPGDGKTPASALSQLNFQGASDVYIEDGSFLAVRNINLGYTLPGVLVQKLRLGSCRVYASANNLVFVTSKSFHGYNPEGYTSGEIAGVGSRPGYNSGSEPVNRVVTFGLNLSF